MLWLWLSVSLLRVYVIVDSIRKPPCQGVCLFLNTLCPTEFALLATFCAYLERSKREISSIKLEQRDLGALEHRGRSHGKIQRADTSSRSLSTIK